MTFSGSYTNRACLEQPKFKVGLGWLVLVPERYPHWLRCNSYCFPSVRLKNVLVKFWWLFQAPTPPEQTPSWQSWKLGPDDLVLYQKHTHTIWGVVLIVSRQNDLKLYQSNFDDFCGTRHHRSRPHTIWGAILIISCQCGWKIFRSNFAYFFRPKHHRSR